MFVEVWAFSAMNDFNIQEGLYVVCIFLWTGHKGNIIEINI